MTRYIAPSVAISSLYSAYYSIFSTKSKRPINSIDDAVGMLNKNEETSEALRYILKYNQDDRFLHKLTPASYGLLALRGSDICNRAPLRKCDIDEDDMVFEQILRRFDLGDDWNSAVEWLNRVACPEEDLSCLENWFVRRPSQVERLHRLLQLLFLKTENEFSKSAIGPEVIPFLYSIYVQFRDCNVDMAMSALKTLSNIALNGEEYATAIFTSEWLALLAKLVMHGTSLEERLYAHRICQNGLHTLGVVDYKLLSNMYELSLPDSTPEVDIVLVHGLCGSVGYTWRQKDKSSNVITQCWPKDWLPIDIAEPIRILAVDYPSYILQFVGSKETLQARADKIDKQLRAAGVGRRPVIFICHSMGGLLVKKLLLDLPALADRTVGILFIATPHRGSPIASYNYPTFSISEDVVFLHEMSPINKKLNEDFSQISDKIPVIVSMVETQKSDLIGTAKGIIVPVQSAVFEKGALYHIEEGHHNVCKPSERTSPVYGVVLNFLRDSIQEAKKMPKS